MTDDYDKKASEVLDLAVDAAMKWVGDDDDESHLLVGYIVIAKFATTGGSTTVATHASDDMDIVTQMGLVEYGRITTQRRMVGEPRD